jgi:histidinol dehydrogenase
MLRILDLSEAEQTILRRKPQGEEIPPVLREGLARVFGGPVTPAEGVRRILADVRTGGDSAVARWTEKIDGKRIDDPSVPAAEWRAAYDRLPEGLKRSLTLAAERIRAFHSRQPIPAWTTGELGGTLGQLVTPLRRAGVYVPGGTAPLPSSLLMSAIPAKVAGVAEVIVVTPPGREGGAVPDVVLACAHLAGVSALYRIGGAQAVAALAFGTETIERVDKIVGAGNLFVTLAKQQVFGLVGLDGLAGPTETVVVADDTADPEWIAADLLAQAEHDRLATAILLTPSRGLAEKVQAQAARQIESRGRAEIIAASLAGQSGIVITPDLAAAAAAADRYAPEHLCLSVADPEVWQERIRCAGGLFLGERSFEVLGDYTAGPSHVMPTGGTARFASPLNVLDFVRITNLIALDEATAAEISPHAETIARAEGLDSHAEAARLRAAAGAPRPAGGEPFRFLPRGCEPEAYSAVIPFEVYAARFRKSKTRIVKLDANENPYGMSKRALERIAAGKYFSIYPDPQNTLLRRRLGEFLGLPPERIFPGAGADELIDVLLSVAADPGDVVIDCPPTFGMYSFSAGVHRLRTVRVGRNPDFSLDVGRIEAAVRAEARAKVLFLCSPNNPDGSVIPDEALRRLLRLPVLVVLDEAYIEFAETGRPPRETGRIGWTLEYENLAVIRTFSKWAGLAGLRIGYGAVPASLMGRMLTVKQPYNVNAAAYPAAMASLDDYSALQKKFARIVAERERMFGRLQKIPGLTVYPSRSNFLLCRIRNRDARALQAELAERGILVRHFDRPGLRDCLRISVGKPKDTDAVVKALKNLV